MRFFGFIPYFIERYGQKNVAKSWRFRKNIKSGGSLSIEKWRAGPQTNLQHITFLSNEALEFFA